jgi:hypothetical protein
MEILEKLFGGLAKAKLIKLFVFNPEAQLSKDEVMTRAKVGQSEVRRALTVLIKLGLVKQKKIWIEGALAKRKVAGYALNPDFVYLKELQTFLLQTAAIKDKDITERFQRSGRLKLIITGGVFLQNWDGRLDLLVVGDNLKQNTAEKAVRSIEAEMGRELTYAIFETEDFRYRYGLYDKLIRDMLDFEHRVILDKIGLAE